MGLTTKSLTELADLVRHRKVSPVEVLDAHLRRIDSLNGSLNAIITIAPNALEEARLAEQRLVEGGAVPPLLGVPVTIKDTIETAGIRSTSGSLVRKDFVPRVDAPAVARLRAAGAIVLGKTNTPEMAIPYETDNPIFGRTNNPYDHYRTPGGSSGGEAAAIASCLSPGGVGSDLSGSIRVPAHFCGIVGLKPTSGRIPLVGHIPQASGPLATAACLGPMARTVADVSLLYNVLSAGEVEKPLALEELRRLRVSWYEHDGVSPVLPEISFALHAAVEALEKFGLRAVKQRPPGTEHGARLWIELFGEASASDLRDFYSGAEDLAGPRARKILEAPAPTSEQRAEALKLAIQERNRLRKRLLASLEESPLILAPVGATPAFSHNTKRVYVNGQTMRVFRAFSYAQTFNVFDLPAIVVRAGQTKTGIPIGIQIVGPPNREQLILTVAAILETELGGWRPPLNTATN